MHQLYIEISKEYKVPVERIMLAITADADFNPLCGRCGKALL
jgi:hypothetical protein